MSFHGIAKGEPVRKSGQMIGVATNTDIFNPMRDDIDLGRGPIAAGILTFEEIGAEILDYLLDIALSKNGKSEELQTRRLLSLRRRGDLIP